MMKSAVTASLVLEAKGGPFVFWAGLDDAFQRASEVGFDAVEIFPPSADQVDQDKIKTLAVRHRLRVAAFGTGGGWVVRKLTLTHPDASVRRAAIEFVRAMIELGAEFGAPAIIGSMQGRWDDAVPRTQALLWLAEALEHLGEQAGRLGATLLFEPLNRYETNLFNRLGDVAGWLQSLRTRRIRILADLFHMNIEEADSAAALREVGSLLGHVHLADSNRHAAGFGHSDMGPIVTALREIGFEGYLSAEILPLPDPLSAARQTMSAFRRYVSKR